ncbi:MAG: 3-hydroxyacyl-ACP dehydratase FabZ [Paracoccaceae bacterium]|nr:3-hydroxyacyl-ACP dehydratase FabZ [Paracoccaceae bacterium]MDE2914981.1 3-hydroxyacyl-ACP dehydratase FabZ [Paracoccaceae bacterium]
MTQADRADIDSIKRMIPHRHPFLLIDSVEQIHLGESAVGVREVSAEEPYFAGHFPGNPIMPGVLIVEAIAQTAAVLVIRSLDMMDANLIVYMMTVDRCRFRKLVRPGDRLELHVRILRSRGKVWRVQGHAMVDGKAVAEAEINAMMVPPEDQSRPE